MQLGNAQYHQFYTNFIFSQIDFEGTYCLYYVYIYVSLYIYSSFGWRTYCVFENIKIHFTKLGGLAPYSHCSSTPSCRGWPLATYSRQVPFVPCEYWTDPNTLCLYEISREKMRAANIYSGIFLLYHPKSRQMDFVMED